VVNTLRFVCVGIIVGCAFFKFIIAVYFISVGGDGGGKFGGVNSSKAVF